MGGLLFIHIGSLFSQHLNEAINHNQPAQGKKYFIEVRAQMCKPGDVLTKG
jgi:hypothetical protein